MILGAEVGGTQPQAQATGVTSSKKRPEASSSKSLWTSLTLPTARAQTAAPELGEDSFLLRAPSFWGFPRAAMRNQYRPQVSVRPRHSALTPYPGLLALGPARKAWNGKQPGTERSCVSHGSLPKSRGRRGRGGDFRLQAGAQRLFSLHSGQ